LFLPTDLSPRGGAYSDGRPAARQATYQIRLEAGADGMLGEACADRGVVAGVKRQICARRDRNRGADQRRVVAWIGAADGKGELRDLGKALADAGSGVGECMRPHRPARGVDALRDTRAGDALQRVLTLAGDEQVGAVAAGLRAAAWPIWT
jgi:hypothetical protein